MIIISVPPREIIDIELEVINVKALDEKYKLEPEITPEEIDQTEYDEFIGVGKYFMTKGKKQVPDKLSLPEELRSVLLSCDQVVKSIFLKLLKL